MTIDGADVYRQFRGTGAINVGVSACHLIDFPEPQRSQILDSLYKLGYGAKLQILKVEIDGGPSTTASLDPSHMPVPNQVNCG